MGVIRRKRLVYLLINQSCECEDDVTKIPRFMPHGELWCIADKDVALSRGGGCNGQVSQSWQSWV